ncbi:hypothetical protein Daus18300_002150 [Diaporthe australafricana]|uniref:F-box domain-containing protein n=1 Tax=Diaporthe australafricana TaxID=127596 RepID=A0ABR3XRK6_9PEZI
MPGLSHLADEVLTLIVEEVCITAELDNRDCLGQTVAVEHGWTPEYEVNDGAEWHQLEVLGRVQADRIFGSCSESLRHQRDQLQVKIAQRFREQSYGRVISGSLLHGVHNSHRLHVGSLHQSRLAEVNELILNHRLDIRCLLALASTCRRLRACAEPFLYKHANLCYGKPCAYAEHLGLMLRYPHLTRYVHLLSFSTTDDAQFESDPYGFVPQHPDELPRAITCLLLHEAPWSREEIYRHLGPERFGPHGLHPSTFRAMFLFLLPDVRSLKFDLELVDDENQGELVRQQWLFRALLQELNSGSGASRVPALQNLQEFSLIFRGDIGLNDMFNPRMLLPFLLLPKMRTFYSSSLNTGHHLLLTESERCQWSGKSAVTEMIFDFARIDGFTLDSLLRLPRALEKLTLNCQAANPFGWELVFWPSRWIRADLIVGDSLSHQRHSLRYLTIRWAGACPDCPSVRQIPECSIKDLKSFVVLEELTAPLKMILPYQDGLPRSLAECLPSSIVCLELLVYNHFPVTTWELEVLDDPASTFELEAEAVVSFGRQVGVDVQVDFEEFEELEPELSANDEDDEWSE